MFSKNIFNKFQRADWIMESSLLAHDLMTDPVLGKMNGTVDLFYKAWSHGFYARSVGFDVSIFSKYCYTS